MGDLLRPALIPLTLIPLAVLFLPGILYCLTLQKALSKCVPTSRTMEPGLVWLYLIPVVNLVFHFFIVIAIAKSLGNEFKRRGVLCETQAPGQSLGLVMCVLACCIIIPLVGLVCAFAGLILWVVYWAKIAQYSARLSATPEVVLAGGSAY